MEQVVFLAALFGDRIQSVVLGLRCVVHSITRRF